MACVAVLNPASTLTLFKSFIEGFVESFVTLHSLEIFVPHSEKHSNGGHATLIIRSPNDVSLLLKKLLDLSNMIFILLS